MPKFLIIRFSSIGDIIQCMGIIDGIKNRFPDSEIHWIARQDMASFLAMDKRIDKVHAFEKREGLRGLWKMAGVLKQEHFDYVYDAHSNIRSSILKLRLLSPCWKIPAYTLRSKERGKRFLLFKWGINRFDNPFRGVVSYRKPLGKWGITDFNSSYKEWCFPQDYPDTYNSLINERTVTLVPSANWPMKRWPVEHWRSLIELLPEYNFVVLAGPTDTFCETLQSVAPERVNNLAGKTSLLASCYLVKKSNMVVSADTGFMHAADLFHVPAIALMGPTAFGYPTGETVRVMEVALPCRPCTKDGRGKCKQEIYQKCMVDIAPQQIASVIRRHLSGNAPRM